MLATLPPSFAADPPTTPSSDSQLDAEALARLTQDTTALSVEKAGQRSVRLNVARGAAGEDVQVQRTVGTEPAASAAEGRSIPVASNDSATATDGAVRPGQIYTYTVFAPGDSTALDNASVTVGTPDPARRLPAYSFRPNVLVPTDAAALNAQRNPDGTATVQLDRAYVEVASATQEMAATLADDTAPLCSVGTPFLLREDVGGAQHFWGVIAACGPGDVATVAPAPLGAVFETFTIAQDVAAAPIDLDTLMAQAPRKPASTRGSASRAGGSCFGDAAGNNILELNSALEPHGHFDVGLDGLTLSWDVEIGLRVSARPRLVTPRAWQCETTLPQVQVPLAGGAVGLRVEIQPVFRASSDGKSRFDQAEWSLDAGVRTTGRIGIEVDYCLEIVPCDASAVFEADATPYFNASRGPDPDVDVVAEITNHAEVATGALVRFEVGPESSFIGSVTGFQFDLLPLRGTLDRYDAAPEPQNCAALGFRPLLSVKFYARIFLDFKVFSWSTGYDKELGSWSLGAGEQRVGDGCTPKADVAITKTAETPTTIAGRSTSWKLDVVNNGPQAAEAVVVTDTLPNEHATAAGLDPACTLTGRQLSCLLGDMAVGASRTLRFNAPVAPSQEHDSTITNSARVSSPTRDKVPSNNTTSALTRIDTLADLSISKVADRGEYDGGDPITYTIKVSNAGPSWARNVVVTDPVPADVKVTSVEPAGACRSAGQQVRCSYDHLTVGEQRTIKVHGTVVGDPPPAHGSTPDHLLGLDRRDTSWSLEPGQQATFAAQSCPNDGIVTDVSWLVSNVDQGTGTAADVVALAVGPTGTSEGGVTLRNDATGRAQGHVFLTCLRPTTVSGDDHRHAVATDPDSASRTSLAPGLQSITMPVGLERLAVAPGYRVLSGATRLVASQPTTSGWTLTFRTAAGGASVETSVRPLHSRTGNAGSPTHVHDLMVSQREETISSAPGRSTHDVACPPGLYQPKTIVGSFSAGADTIIGHEGRENTRAFQLDNLGSGSSTSTLGVVCLQERTGPEEDFVPLVVNTASVTSTTRDDNTADNSASASISVHRAVPGPRAARITLKQVRIKGRTLMGSLISKRAGRATLVVRSNGHVVGRRTVTLKAERRTPVTVRLRGHRSNRVVVMVRTRGADDQAVVRS